MSVCVCVCVCACALYQLETLSQLSSSSCRRRIYLKHAHTCTCAAPVTVTTCSFTCTVALNNTAGMASFLELKRCRLRMFLPVELLLLFTFKRSKLFCFVFFWFVCFFLSFFGSFFIHRYPPKISGWRCESLFWAIENLVNFHGNGAPWWGTLLSVITAPSFS